MDIKYILSYLKYGSWHYYYRSHYLIFLIGVIISLAISYAIYLYSDILLVIFILTLWFEEKLILLYIIYFAFYDDLRDWFIQAINIQSSLLESFAKMINKHTSKFIYDTFELLNNSIIDAFYSNVLFLILLIAFNRALLNIISRHLLKVYI